MPKIDITIVILTKNASSNFPLLLKKIYAQKCASSFEVLVIDSGSTDGTLPLTASYPVRLVQIKPEEFHHGRTRNLGAELAHGNMLVYITQDALPLDEYWLQNLTYNLKDNNVGMVCGRQIPWPHVKPCEKFFYSYHFTVEEIELKQGACENYNNNMFISDVNSAYRRDIWAKFRFSADIMLAEDKEMAYRLLKSGLRLLYKPQAMVYHAHNDSIGEAFNRHKLIGNNYRSAEVQMAAGVSPADRSYDYLKAEMRYMLGSRYYKWIPYTIIYEFSKAAGYLAGRYLR